MKIEDAVQEMPVIVTEGDQEVPGYIESWSSNKINVRIIKPGHKQHGLIVPFDPDFVEVGITTAIFKNVNLPVSGEEVGALLGGYFYPRTWDE